MYYTCTFCTCAKHKSAVVNYRRRPLPPQSQLFPSQMYYPCTLPLTCMLHKYKRYMGSTFEKGIINSQRRTIADGWRPLTCILHKYNRYMGSTSEKGIIETAEAKAVVDGWRPLTCVLQVKSEPTSPCISPHVLGSWKPGDDLHTMLRPQESEQHPCFALKRASSSRSLFEIE
jgi:hypothetical protein